MIEIIGDMWREGARFDAVCITTNGSVRKSDGSAVMGRGCAAEAAKFWPDIPGALGGLITDNGNVVQVLREVLLPAGARCATFSRTVTLVSFPVKPMSMAIYSDEDAMVAQAAVNNCVVAHMRGQFKPGQIIPGWACMAQLGLIRDSALQLIHMTNRLKWKKVLLPRPGCGAGELKWDDVRPVLSMELDDRFTVISRRL